ncbi:MAG: polysaccharide deacetylase 2 family uncharacterized protein YibQ [Arcobacteraceae bacterium]|jgi:polysaccharide deacetylase 2 family uncharacterized protein YibQ
MKKNTQHRPPKKTKNKTKESYKRLFAIILISIIMLLGLATGSYFGTEIDNVVNNIKDSLSKEIKTTDVKIKEKKEVLHFEEPNLDEIDKENEKLTIESSVLIPEIINNTHKPKLAIIIDDMTTQRQINSVLSLGYTVNMSFLPPTKGHKNSAKITNNLDKYMIHLPLQASSSKYEEELTLHINDSVNKIEERIKSLKALYPNTSFLNNHTGSKFTSNQQAMDKLFVVLKKYKYTFIDSRTTSKTVAAISAKKYGVKMFSRNIFLDNNKNKEYIQNQLKKAIKSAKKNGMAIAIGHPYGITFKTLKDSKYLLKDLELVYVQNL